MEEVVNNIKEKLSTDNLVEMMKDAKVIDNERVKEEEVRKSLDKMDMNNFIHADKLAEQLNKITEQAAATEADHKVVIVEPARPSLFSVLSQSKDNIRNHRPVTDDEDYMIKDNVTGFLD